MSDSDDGNTIILDTKYWIRLKKCPDDLAQFKEALSEDDEVLFSYGNYMELIKRDEQDTLSRILAETVETYIPSMDYDGDTYISSDDPVDLIPEESLKPTVRSHAMDFGEEKTLRFLFRAHDWDPSETVYTEMTDTMRDIEDKYGFENSYAAAFPDYLEESDDGEFIIREEEIDVAEYVRKLFGLYRIRFMKDNENIDEHDLPDMEICTHAVLTDCDLLLIESKWKNLEIVNKVTSHLEGNETLQVIDSFEELIRIVGN
ncbi:MULTISPECIES: hypothetical protein [Haloarcula]|uniref:hypothetical protein n=1 Tax=Haloarcula TaxID=2237 RepID=UPI000F8E2E11|nr:MULTISPECIES: hypothetical protein [Haloarcula]NHX41407.1 hypothetical protein [Haloarcula sp. R1-2]